VGDRSEIRGLDPDTRVKTRLERSAAMVATLFDLWEKELPRLSGKSKLAEAIRYALSRRAALERFLTDGRIEIDSIIVERAIRPQTITRKNALFAVCSSVAMVAQVRPPPWLPAKSEFGLRAILDLNH
jgi:transposase